MGKVRENISKNITKYRKSLKLSQKDLALQLGTKPSTVSSWEQEASIPNAETIFEICKIFNISINEIYGIEEDETEFQFRKVCEWLEEAGLSVEKDEDSDYDFYIINDLEKGTISSMQKQDMINLIESIIQDGEYYKEKFIIDKIRLLFSNKEK